MVYIKMEMHYYQCMKLAWQLLIFLMPEKDIIFVNYFKLKDLMVFYLKTRENLRLLYLNLNKLLTLFLTKNPPTRIGGFLKTKFN